MIQVNQSRKAKIQEVGENLIMIRIENLRKMFLNQIAAQEITNRHKKKYPITRTLKEMKIKMTLL